MFSLKISWSISEKNANNVKIEYLELPMNHVFPLLSSAFRWKCNYPFSHSFLLQHILWILSSYVDPVWQKKVCKRAMKSRQDAAAALVSSPGAFLPWGKAEREEIAQPGEQNAQGDLINEYKYLKEGFYILLWLNICTSSVLVISTPP